MPELTGEKLDAFLSVISEAPDFSTAATFLVAQIADAVGARRAFALTLTNSGCVCARDTSPALITSDEHGQVVVKANPDRSKSCEWLAPGPVPKVQVVR